MLENTALELSLPLPPGPARCHHHQLLYLQLDKLKISNTKYDGRKASILKITRKNIHFDTFFFFFYLPWVFVAACRLSPSCSEQGLLFVVVCGLLIGWLLLLQSTGSRHAGFSSWGTRAQ